MSRTTFKNASGLPNPAQVTTARDMATLGLRLMRDYPQYYPYFRSTSFIFKGRVIRGHNRLLGRFAGTDGIKTGYTNASGYNLVTSTKRDNKRVVGVVMGARSSGKRNAHMMLIIARAMPRAHGGVTIAALAGSSKGIINPIAKRQQVATAPQPPSADDDKDLLAAVAQEAAVDTREDEDDVAEASGNAEPKVIEAKLVDTKKKPKRLPFVVKAGAVQPTEVASVTETFTVQIGQFPSKKAAQTALSDVRAAVGGEIMRDKDAYTLAVKKNGKVTYRVMISGFTEETAKMSCAKASRMGKSCTVLNAAG
jgi:D-alanyl-D-alanine carboxypeptidase